MKAYLQPIRDTLKHACQNPTGSIKTLTKKTCDLFSQNKIALGTMAATALTCYYSPRTITTHLPEVIQQYPRLVLATAGTLVLGTTKALQTRNTQNPAVDEQQNPAVDEQ